MKNLKFIIGGAIFLIAFLFLNPFGYNNSTERVVIQPVNGELDVQFNPGLYYAGFFAKTYTYPNNVTIQCGPEGIVFPKIVAGGQGPNGSSGALQTLELKMLNDLAKEMAKSKN